MNQLKVNQQEAIIALHERGWSKRKIARELGLDRVTVRKLYSGRKITRAANRLRRWGRFKFTHPATGSLRVCANRGGNPSSRRWEWVCPFLECSPTHQSPNSSPTPHLKKVTDLLQGL